MYVYCTVLCMYMYVCVLFYNMCVVYMYVSAVGAGLSGGGGSQGALEGDNVTLLCGTQLTGNPLPVVAWTDNNGL